MNLADLTFQSIRFLLLPFSLVYGGIIWLRNRLYDWGVLESTSFNLPMICIGNLSIGGTGKSPMVELLLEYFTPLFTTATLSRGYKRKTRGYVLANTLTTALEIGDEPMVFHTKFSKAAVAVGESRVEAIPQLLQDRKDIQVVILDDAFQHRAIKAGLNILLTECANLYTGDFFLPTGDLRDEKKSAQRADIIIVTKCPDQLSIQEADKIRASIRLLPHQHLFFTSILYGSPFHILDTNKLISLDQRMELLLVTGIANAAPLEQYILERVFTYERMSFSDHHIFTIDDVNEIEDRFNRMHSNNKMILTTEKDAVRFIKFGNSLQHLPLYVIPIRHQFLFDKENEFKHKVIDFVQHFSHHTSSPH
ncbi:MAG: tetraacyldisaccharide 4'-kinase [Chitinophagaceae bacterium]